MNNQLHHIQREDWPELAKQAGYSASKLAKNCGVSLRTLQRHFLKEFGQAPKAWLIEQRNQKAAGLLKTGLIVKETAASLGYEHFNNLSRDYKDHTGYCPTDKSAPIRAQSP